MIKKRQRRTKGAFVKVPFDSEYHAYGRILTDACMAFYDFKTKEEIIDLELIASKPILFITGVHKYGVTQGHWEIIGKLPLEPNLQKNPPACWWNVHEPHLFRIYDNGKEYIVKKKHCIGLERFAVWDHEAIEERIRNHYDGVPNRILERFKKQFDELTKDF